MLEIAGDVAVGADEPAPRTLSTRARVIHLHRAPLFDFAHGRYAPIPPPKLRDRALTTNAKTIDLTRRTLEHYEHRAAAFWEGTRDHDVAQNLGALLDAIDGEAPYRILDLGCGPGRDLIELRRRGHEPVGLDGAAAFVEMARANSGAEVWHQNFVALELPAARFDGVFANASLFHVPAAELPRVLGELRRCLRPRGVLFSSNPRGENSEGFSGTRYGAYYDLARWTELLTAAGFEVVHHYYRPPGRPRAEQPWLATVAVVNAASAP